MSADRAVRLAESARRAFEARFGSACRVAYAPGRVNLVGEHTDYNDGFVLPMALDLGVAVAYSPRADGELVMFATDDAQPNWRAYVAGVHEALAERGFRTTGANLLIAGDVPIGAGLSSSAALEVAVARAAADMATLPWEPAPFAKLCQYAEHRYVGVPCGIMDQMAAAATVAGHALLLDCRSLETQLVSIGDEISVVVIDTGERRRLASSAYADRRAACERAVAAIRVTRPEVRALRDASLADLDAISGDTDAATVRRARHVIDENARVLAFVAALERSDYVAAGALLDASHASLRDLYEVSSPGLDRVVAAARAHPACLGARMTGAGFGGCAVALVRSDAASSLVSLFDRAFVARASAGARLIG